MPEPTTPVDLSEVEALHRAKWTAATREAYYKQSPENFAGEGDSFPIKDASDVNDAWRLAGHAPNPDAVRSKIKSIAKRLGLTSGLPDTATDSDKDDGDRVADASERVGFTSGPSAGPAGDSTPAPLQTAGKPIHPPFVGKHAHGHAHMDGYDHEHPHEHNNDSHHDHAHEHHIRTQETELPRVSMPEMPHLYLPITRIDNDKWEVEGVATSEAVDTYGTVFSYEASKAAFQKWINRTANVREMHQKMAVGKGMGVFFDDANKQVIVRSRVSRGARDTWTKVQEGVLTGYSVGAINPVWETVDRNGKTYPYLTNYDLTELSLVDNPSNPDSFQLTICRADGLVGEVIEVSEAEQAVVPPVLPTLDPVERAGARISADTRSQLHSTIDALKKTCGCQDCMGETDGDGDNDGDERIAKMTEELHKTVEKVIERVLAPIYSRQQQFLARLAQTAQSDDEPTEQTDHITPLVAELQTLKLSVERMAQVMEKPPVPDEVRTELSVVRDLVERIAAQPAPGGPVMNGVPMPRPAANKVLATDRAPSMQPQNMEAVLNLLQEKGLLDTLDKQVQAASLMVQPMRGRVGG